MCFVAWPSTTLAHPCASWYKAIRGQAPLSHILVLRGIRPSVAKKKRCQYSIIDSAFKFHHLTACLIMLGC